jgi:hypothetical protein
MKVIVSIAAAGLLASPTAFAQPATTQAPPTAVAASHAGTLADSSPDVRQMIRTDLLKLATPT